MKRKMGFLTEHSEWDMVIRNVPWSSALAVGRVRKEDCSKMIYHPYEYTVSQLH